jgi:hypothetical protein
MFPKGASDEFLVGIIISLLMTEKSFSDISQQVLLNNN